MRWWNSILLSFFLRRLFLMPHRGFYARSRDCLLRCIYSYIYIHKSSFYSFRNGQLYIANPIVCITDIYFDSTLSNSTYQLLVDSRRISFEPIIITTTITSDFSYAAASTSNNDGHSCISILSTPFNVDMVVR